MSEKCSEWIFAGSWNGHACPHPGKVEVGGKWYCGVHDPLTREAKRNAAGEAKLAAQWKAEAIRKQESAEQARKLALWPEIIETLEDGLLQLRHGNGCASRVMPWAGVAADKNCDCAVSHVRALLAKMEGAK